jgi:oxygen-independent coproporphyrinogen-3 oxidase
MISPRLIQKYNIPGPRYTSYPTVPYWDRNPNESQWIEALNSSIRDSIKTGTGAAIYVHIPFCESLCTYCGCNNRITRNHGESEPYIQTLLREFSLYREKLGLTRKMKLGELHLGGGTPTFFTPSELQMLLSGILEHCELTVDHELSIEVDPRVTSREHLTLLREFGFNRISLGVQDFDPKVQDIVHRVQSVEQVQSITEIARLIGFTSVNFDLIYGLPLQTLQSIEQTIEQVMRLKPDRIAFYSYAHVPWIRAGQRRFTESDLPSGDEKRRLYERGRELLEKAGYVEIGMDHFALTHDSLYTSAKKATLHRNFMGYTARMVNPIIALGVSAIGDAWSVFAQNEKLLENYVDRVQKGEIPIARGHILDPEDLILRKHILNLMTGLQTSWNNSTDFVPYLSEVPTKLEELVKDGLLVLEKDRCLVTEVGRPFLRNICMAFDARLNRKSPESKLFSSTL